MIAGKHFTTQFRIAVVIFIIFIFYTVIAIRLWFVQVKSGEATQERVSRQYVRNIRVPALRGRIIAADGVTLAGNRVSYDLVFHLSEMRQPGRLSRTVDHIMKKLQRASVVVGRPVPYTKADILAKINQSPGLPLHVFPDLDPKELASASEFVPYAEGTEIVYTPIRHYPCGTLACHLLGYVRREDPFRADDRTRYSYYVPGFIGASGLEKVCDTWVPDRKDTTFVETGAPDTEMLSSRKPLLRGIPGKQLIVVDHMRFVRKIIEPSLPAENGKDIILTLEARAQRIAEKLISGKAAAMILMDASNGTVLAMASSPGFSPADFVPKISGKHYNELLHAPGQPFFNKAIQGAYSPGSIVKPLMGLAFLENAVPAERQMICDGATWFGETPLNCWIRPVSGGGHGPLDLKEAITVSCNDYFAENSRALGVDRLRPVLISAGIGRKTGFCLPESGGRIPDTRHKDRWTSFDTALVSIGQGDILLTPLQAAVYTSAIANGGTMWIPRILDRIADQDGNIVYRWLSKRKGQLAVSKEHLLLVQKAMHNAVYSPHGGARSARCESIMLSGKTGTAEVGPKSSRYKNAWFIGFGTDPKSGRILAITVFVSHGVSGGKSAAPLAQAFFEEYLQ